ncbi:lipoprotein [Aeromonas diversa CDC 2478-85]|uniref:Lipoprotein n=1 Tax=Aeromonas diversa CDC 2478-85 TaxID=1268237 RepID=N9VNX1_9GAMM|nr:YajG family lipoprotein [Aeromonas diversa]ENY73061.1 lipoprotein [Aeromonas diversa CDC 2478-85]
MKKSLILMAALALGGCATSWPETAYINPQIIPANQQYYSGNSITLEGIDRREAAYVISVKKKEKAPVLVNPYAPLGQILSDKLSEGLRSQGLNVGNTGTTNLQLEVLQAAVNVEEKTFTYVTKSKVSLRATADFQGNRVSKQYNASSSKEGPGQPDMSELESTLNQQLSGLLQQVLADQQLRGYLKGQPG